ncbi:hypothetical protein J6590_093612 [Homalodisca vitripennis]|nr:hypothetical protein J6590_093612 [Homalodisca vitripennis]
MIVAAMRPAIQGPGMTAPPRFQGNHRTTAATTTNTPTPAAARGESTRQRPASVPTRTPFPRLLHQNAQYATNKLDKIQLISEELKSDILVVTENGFNNENLELFKIPNSKLAEAYCRQIS